MASPPVDRAGTRAAVVLSVVMVAWGGAIPVAALEAFRSGWPAVASSAVYATGALVCHQKPDRSFRTDGRPWPVCARCSGIYLSGAAAVAVLVAWRRAGRPARRDVRWPLAFGLALSPIAVTWLVERAGVLDVSNVVRAVSGVPVGCVVAAALASLVPHGPGPRGN